MDSIHGVIQDANDVDEAISQGFSSIPMPVSHIDDSALEAELNSLIAEEGASRKRESAVPDLPTIPSGRLIDTSDVERRLKRLREGVTSN